MLVGGGIQARCPNSRNIYLNNYTGKKIRLPMQMEQVRYYSKVVAQK